VLSPTVDGSHNRGRSALSPPRWPVRSLRWTRCSPSPGARPAVAGLRGCGSACLRDRSADASRRRPCYTLGTPLGAGLPAGHRPVRHRHRRLHGDAVLRAGSVAAPGVAVEGANGTGRTAVGPTPARRRGAGVGRAGEAGRPGPGWECQDPVEAAELVQAIVLATALGP
jgi:hypothetical protein